ncbi:hypothetical protein Q8F55_009146 [Vanrija albida]|uniref:Uncharacterized protein n=1 Tax=Vanrija albida TaxID=181172 RepID=A0ABR3PSS7_9TREE
MLALIVTPKPLPPIPSSPPSPPPTPPSSQSTTTTFDLISPHSSHPALDLTEDESSDLEHEADVDLVPRQKGHMPSVAGASGSGSGSGAGSRGAAAAAAPEPHRHRPWFGNASRTHLPRNSRPSTGSSRVTAAATSTTAVDSDGFVPYRPPFASTSAVSLSPQMQPSGATGIGMAPAPPPARTPKRSLFSNWSWGARRKQKQKLTSASTPVLINQPPQPLGGTKVGASVPYGTTHLGAKATQGSTLSNAQYELYAPYNAYAPRGQQWGPQGVEHYQGVNHSSSVLTGLVAPKMLFSPIARDLRTDNGRSSPYSSSTPHLLSMGTQPLSEPHSAEAGPSNTRPYPRVGENVSTGNLHGQQRWSSRWQGSTYTLHSEGSRSRLAVSTVCDALTFPKPRMNAHDITPPESPQNRNTVDDDSIVDFGSAVALSDARDQEREEWAEVASRGRRSRSLRRSSDGWNSDRGGSTDIRPRPSNASRHSLPTQRRSRSASGSIRGLFGRERRKRGDDSDANGSDSDAFTAPGQPPRVPRISATAPASRAASIQTERSGSHRSSRRHRNFGPHRLPKSTSSPALSSEDDHHATPRRSLSFRHHHTRSNPDLLVVPNSPHQLRRRPTGPPRALQLRQGTNSRPGTAPTVVVGSSSADYRPNSRPSTAPQAGAVPAFGASGSYPSYAKHVNRTIDFAEPHIAGRSHPSSPPMSPLEPPHIPTPERNSPFNAEFNEEEIGLAITTSGDIARSPPRSANTRLPFDTPPSPTGRPFNEDPSSAHARYLLARQHRRDMTIRAFQSPPLSPRRAPGSPPIVPVVPHSAPIPQGSWAASPTRSPTGSIIQRPSYPTPRRQASKDRDAKALPPSSRRPATAPDASNGTPAFGEDAPPVPAHGILLKRGASGRRPATAPQPSTEPPVPFGDVRYMPGVAAGSTATALLVAAAELTNSPPSTGRSSTRRTPLGTPPLQSLFATLPITPTVDEPVPPLPPPATAPARIPPPRAPPPGPPPAVPPFPPSRGSSWESPSQSRQGSLQSRTGSSHSRHGSSHSRAGSTHSRQGSSHSRQGSFGRPAIPPLAVFTAPSPPPVVRTATPPAMEDLADHGGSPTPLRHGSAPLAAPFAPARPSTPPPSSTRPIVMDESPTPIRQTNVFVLAPEKSPETPAPTAAVPGAGALIGTPSPLTRSPLTALFQRQLSTSSLSPSAGVTGAAAAAAMLTTESREASFRSVRSQRSVPTAAGIFGPELRPVVSTTSSASMYEDASSGTGTETWESATQRAASSPDRRSIHSDHSGRSEMTLPDLYPASSASASASALSHYTDAREDLESTEAGSSQESSILIDESQMTQHSHDDEHAADRSTILASDAQRRSLLNWIDVTPRGSGLATAHRQTEPVDEACNETIDFRTSPASSANSSPRHSVDESFRGLFFRTPQIASPARVPARRSRGRLADSFLFQPPQTGGLQQPIGLGFQSSPREGPSDDTFEIRMPPPAGERIPIPFPPLESAEPSPTVATAAQAAQASGLQRSPSIITQGLGMTLNASSSPTLSFSPSASTSSPISRNGSWITESYRSAQAAGTATPPQSRHGHKRRATAENASDNVVSMRPLATTSFSPATFGVSTFGTAPEATTITTPKPDQKSIGSSGTSSAGVLTPNQDIVEQFPLAAAIPQPQHF